MHESLRKLVGLCLVGLLALGAAAARADPPYRAARLSYETGVVTFSPAGDTDWARAPLNRPLTAGDRLWVDRGSGAELQVDGAALRMGEDTSASLLNLDDRMVQVRLDQGSLALHVWAIRPDQAIEIDTANLAFSIRHPGSYRIDVDPNEASTAVLVRSGSADVYGEGASFRLGAGDGYRFYDTGLRDYERFAAGPPDALDRWAAARTSRREHSVSARYVPRGLIGYEDLDDYGTWRDAPGYGRVWIPTRAPAGWAPYRDGHWAWVEPWGWTWIDDAPWGFASSHYGRWTRVSDQWAWVPGPATATPVYAPALVVFVTGVAAVAGNAPAVAWFPLAPQEVYRPAYPVSRQYFTRVNTSNTVINETRVTNVYNTTNVTNVTYANARVPGAVVAVPRNSFVQARPVARDAVPVQPAQVAAARVAPAPPIAPIRASLAGTAPAAHTPPAAPAQRPVVAHTPPPPHPAPVDQRLAALSAQPGRVPPPASTAPPPPVKLAQPTQAVAAPATSPPPAVPGGRAAEHRAAHASAGASPHASAPAASGAGSAPVAPRPAAPAVASKPAPAAVHPPHAATQHPERGQGVAPAPKPAPAAAPAPLAPAAPPQAAAHPPTVAPRVAPEQHVPPPHPPAPEPKAAIHAAPPVPPTAARPAPHAPQAGEHPGPAHTAPAASAPAHPAPPAAAVHRAEPAPPPVAARAERHEPPKAAPPAHPQHAGEPPRATPEAHGKPAHPPERHEGAGEGPGG